MGETFDKTQWVRETPAQLVKQAARLVECSLDNIMININMLPKWGKPWLEECNKLIDILEKIGDLRNQITDILDLKMAIPDPQFIAVSEKGVVKINPLGKKDERCEKCKNKGITCMYCHNYDMYSETGEIYTCRSCGGGFGNFNVFQEHRQTCDGPSPKGGRGGSKGGKGGK